ncbi:hypothetical protein TNCT_524451 [Trichonephila clavata]|uniref:Uncharacterized protein n=1 Tax=Trichonephila clavata TaxID=2740835 RepID=A0A8X6GDC7_TRICU|nr:hypothetical protein TNCT_524451 [Trichonephila clavata]
MNSPMVLVLMLGQNCDIILCIIISMTGRGSFGLGALGGRGGHSNLVLGPEMVCVANSLSVALSGKLKLTCVTPGVLRRNLLADLLAGGVLNS